MQHDAAKISKLHRATFRRLGNKIFEYFFDDLLYGDITVFVLLILLYSSQPQNVRARYPALLRDFGTTFRTRISRGF